MARETTTGKPKTLPRLLRRTKLGVVEGERKTKEKFFTTTKAGQDACQRYIKGEIWRL